MKRLSKAVWGGMIFLLALGLQPDNSFTTTKTLPGTNTLIWQMPTAEAASNRNEFCQEMYNNMVERKEDFTIPYTGNTSEIADNIEGIMEQVFNMRATKNSDDYDYLRWNWKNWNFNTYSNGQGGVDFKFNIIYREPADRLAAVNQTVKQVLPGLIGSNDFETVKNVHDYVVNQINYDQTIQRFTAYEGLLENSTVCQGYALLMYKMLTDAGIPVRFMEGYAGEAHAWNIVKLNGKWYFLDATWDDPITGGKPVLRYDYFLVGSDKLYKDHQPNKRWFNSDVQAAYNISPTDYDPSYAETEDKKSMDEPTYKTVNLREEFRKVMVQAFDEAKSYDSQNKLAQHAMDLNKKVIIAAFSGMSDDAFNKMLADENGAGKLIDIASKRFEEVIFNPLESYVDTKEYETISVAAMTKFTETHKMEGLTATEAEALTDKMMVQITEQILDDKLHRLSKEHTTNLISELTQSFENMYK